MNISDSKIIRRIYQAGEKAAAFWRDRVVADPNPKSPLYLYDEPAADPEFDPSLREYPNEVLSEVFDPSIRYCKGCGREFFATDPRQTRCKENCGKEDARSGDRHRRSEKRDKDRHILRDRSNRSLPIMAIDGEGGGVDELGRQHYRLMCASAIDAPAHNLYRDNAPLTTKECFDFILGLPKEYLLVAFGFNYDVTQICRQLPRGRLEFLARAKPKTAQKEQAEARMTAAIDQATTELEALAPGSLPESLKHILSKRVFDGNEVYDWSLEDLEDLEIFAAMFDDNTPPHASTDWNGYNLKWLPHRFFSVAKRDPKTGTDVPGTRRTIFDVFGFFQGSFLETLGIFGVGTPEQLALIEKNKAERKNFDLMDAVRQEYCELECRLLAELMTQFRDTVLTAEHRYHAKRQQEIRLWSSKPYGAGSIAAEMFKSKGVPRRPRPDRHPSTHKPNEYPLRERAFNNICAMAYYGGRFEISRTGHIPGPIYEYDIHSAYPAAMGELPCPCHTEWVFSPDRPPRGALYVGLIDFEHPPDSRWCAFPWRDKQGNISFPTRGRGAYWSCEIEAAEQLFGANITWLGGWRAVQRCECRPFDFIPFMYDFRKTLETEKKGSGIAFKLGPNSAYGKTCQGVGSAPYRDMVSAGLITAITRTRLLKAIALDPDAIVMCATDGIYSLRRLRLPISDALGDWECKEHGSMFIVMPGVYWFPEEEGTSKTRGVSKKVLERYRSKIKDAWDHLDEQRLSEILISGALPETAHRAPYPYTYISSPSFIGIRQALAWEQASDADPNATLRYAGVWQLECEDEHCSHEKCGKRRVSFDWSSKRYGGKLIEWQDSHGATQRYVEHRPVLGARSAMSTPSQPKLLTLFEEHKMLYEAMPDLLEQIEEASEFSGSVDE